MNRGLPGCRRLFGTCLAAATFALLLPVSTVRAAVLSEHARGRMLNSGIAGERLVAALDAAERVPVIILFATPASAARNATADPRARRAAIARAGHGIMRRLRQGDFAVRHQFENVNAMAGDLTADGLLRLLEAPEVERVDLDSGGTAHLAEAVPLARLDVVQRLGLTGQGVTVAVLDSGLDTDHPDLSDDLVAEECFCSFGCCPNGTARQSGAGSAEDDAGHGTNVTGVITSKGTIAPLGGAPDAHIVAIKVLDRDGRFQSSADIIAALDWILSNRPDVNIVNMSLGTNDLFAGDCDEADSRTRAFAAAIDTLRARQVLVFASSGNQASGTSMAAPACIASTIAVGAVWDANVGPRGGLGCFEATTAADQVTCFSNSDAMTDLFAPGGPMVSTGLRGLTSEFTGTSQASPMAAACAAVLLQRGPTLTADAVEAALESSSTRVTDVTNGLDFPRVDCAEALAAIGPFPPSLTPTPTPTPTPSPSLTPTPSATLTPTATVTATPSNTLNPPTAGPACTGDCDGNRSIAINELVLGVSIALEENPLTACPSFDQDDDRRVSVDELITAVNHALSTCP